MGDRIHAGERLERGQFLESNNKKFKLYLRSDGKVRLFRFVPGRKSALGRISGYDCGDTGFLWLTPRGYLFGGREMGGRHYGWSRPRNGFGPNYEGAVMYMQDDGNLVIYDRNANVIWSTGTHGSHSLAINPDLKVVTLGAGTLAIDNSRANTIFENPHPNPVTISDGINAVVLDRGSPQAVFAPRGPGSLAISGHSYTFDLDSDSQSADATVGYQPDTIATRSGNTWTIGSGGAWLVDPSEGNRPLEEVEVPSQEQYEWMDYGMTDDDKARLNGDLPPLEDKK